MIVCSEALVMVPHVMRRDQMTCFTDVGGWAGDHLRAGFDGPAMPAAVRAEAVIFLPSAVASLVIGAGWCVQIWAEGAAAYEEDVDR